MPKIKYKYNPELLSYDKIKTSVKRTVVRMFTLSTASLAIIVLSYIALSPFFDTPGERVLSRELNQATSEYHELEGKLNQLEVVLNDMQQRDDNIYRTVFKAEPAQTSRQTFETDLYEYSNDELMASIDRRIRQIIQQTDQQTGAYEELLAQTEKQKDVLLSRPSIQPIDNKNLKRTASGYGERIQPFSNTRFFHKGIDFTAPIGTKIYATGDGIISKRGVVPGMGNRIIIDHGHGYQTLYAHMKEFAVKAGDSVKRGQTIGTVGNTGVSSGPHLHYEVHKNGKAVNPINYFFSDLTPESFAMIQDLANMGKTLD
ncbi:MAG: M23 family metallopeptidase [Bacteroidales bacterium]|jgi:murein DD-endopeptidase MepM/ murein hydrolase activator NlpD|nr:M23 family metallopeptidase [Bacteroidales bacterium]